MPPMANRITSPPTIPQGAVRLHGPASPPIRSTGVQSPCRSHHRRGEEIHALAVDAGCGAGNADAGDGTTGRIENRRADAAGADFVFLIVNGVPADLGRPQFRARRAGSMIVWGVWRSSGAVASIFARSASPAKARIALPSAVAWRGSLAPSRAAMRRPYPPSSPGRPPARRADAEIDVSAKRSRSWPAVAG